MTAMTLSAAKQIIRDAREHVSRLGKFEGQEPWVAALYCSDWWGCEDEYAGDEMTWCGLWIMPWDEVRAEQADDSYWFLLFRELRGSTCITVSESEYGFVTGEVHFESVDKVAALMHKWFDPKCPYCGATLDDEYIGLVDGERVCTMCAKAIDETA